MCRIVLPILDPSQTQQRQVGICTLYILLLMGLHKHSEGIESDSSLHCLRLVLATMPVWNLIADFRNRLGWQIVQHAAVS